MAHGYGSSLCIPQPVKPAEGSLYVFQNGAWVPVDGSQTYVTLATPQTITGAKTFAQQIVGQSGLTLGDSFVVDKSGGSVVCWIKADNASQAEIDFYNRSGNGMAMYRPGAGTGLNWYSTTAGIDVLKIVDGAASAGVFQVKWTTASTTSTDGALTVAGGVGIVGALNVGSGISVAGQLTISGAAPVPIMNCSAASDATTLTYFSFRRNNVEKGYFGFGDGASGIMRISNSIGELLLTAPSGIRATSGALTSSDPTSGIGYSAGAGGTVAQATSKSTGVTLNKVCGTITMNAAALAADTSVSFTLTDSAIAANDQVLVQHDNTGTLGAYHCTATPAAGSASVTVRNLSPGSLSEAIVLRFIVVKAVVT